MSCPLRGRRSSGSRPGGRGRERQWRPARLEAGPLEEVAEWTERYRRFWEKSYNRLDPYLDALQERGRGKADGRER